MQRIVSLLLFTLLLLTPKYLRAADPPGQIAVFPSMFELNIGSKPVNESIRLKNLKSEPVTIKVEAYNWKLDEQNNLKTLPSDNQSLDQWMLINPLTFTIEPNKEQVVRFSIRPNTVPNPGEHRAIVYFIEQAPASASSATVQVLFKLGVGIYGYADPVKHSAVLNSLTLDRPSRTLKVDIENNGNVHTRLKGEYAIWKKGAFPGFNAMKNALNASKEQKKPEGLLASGSMNNTPILAGNRRTISTTIPAPDEKSGYMVTVQGTIDGTKVEKVFP
jgi:fimbrial chaperone protein